jgi:hypothetical protein
MSTLNIDYPNHSTGPVGEDGMNDFQRSSLAFWITHLGRRRDITPILTAVKTDPRLLLWADWPTILQFGVYLKETNETVP